MKSLLMLLCLALVSCATKAPPSGSYVAQKRPEVTAKVRPAVAAVRSAQEAADQRTETATAHVATVVREAHSVTEGLQQAAATAKTLSDEGPGGADLVALAGQITSLQVRNRFVEAEAEKAFADLTAQRELRAQTNARVADLEAAAADKDAEAAELRTQFEDEAASNLAASARAAQSEAAREKERQEHARELASAATDRDRLAGEVFLYRVVLGIVGGLLLLYVIGRVGLKWLTGR